MGEPRRMGGPRGVQHAGKSTVFPVGKTIRATLVLHPDDAERKLYEELVTGMGVAGAQVLREALHELHKRETKKRKARERRQQAKQAASATTEELPKAG
ncbi:hypothetical protein ACH4VM_24705 [Streptomyces sp. NPDC020792]|uniref:hypothetical protein n=1 Tax=Streptomyces sp. NPDC020792 TaxID=3365089 RepID=UPI0037B1C949